MDALDDQQNASVARMAIATDLCNIGDFGSADRIDYTIQDA